MLKTKSQIVPVDELLQELKGNIFPYWMKKMVDEEHGGFYGKRDGHDKLVKDAPKAIILNTRILWTFSYAARTFSEPSCLKIADRAYHYILDHFLDKVNGGVYWTVDFEGRPFQTKKQVYAQAFAIYALTEYYLATNDRASLDEAAVSRACASSSAPRRPRQASMAAAAMPMPTIASALRVRASAW